MLRTRFSVVAVLLGLLILTGCDGGSSKPPVAAPSTAASTDEVAIERAKLDPADRAAVDAQEWCVINTSERLGSMGAPIKLEVGGQSVFICCKGCQRRAEADPAKTLAKLDELKAKARTDKAKP